MKLIVKEAHTEDGMTVGPYQWIEKTDGTLYAWRFHRVVTNELYDRMVNELLDGKPPVGDSKDLAARKYLKFGIITDPSTLPSENKDTQ
ncbi:hypothetical protein [Aeromonas phage AS-yj]|uniref:Uncharacterized protein n=3 Tax=Ceceduovirus TaxID=2842588 RepID=A0A223LEN0_9CAUD|nr:hypothetical protein HWB28_gp206 [Aeromonas phage AS-zj]YP_009834730.1 hypothetical protein HWB29_gp028 [Aeromonas phage AS-sw]ASU00346.1 hypothetical protein [Aeromonas phage AS-zj]ATI17857.1 hypothetical protein [Aeromonas phage AS-yj]ATI18078.1 hypothetical protein [Aeromonas phage AS-sw]